MINQQFRRDYWAKGAARLTHLQQVEGLAAERVVLVSQRPQVELKVKAPLGEVSLHAPVYDPILDLLGDHRPRSIGEIAKAMQPRNVTLKQVMEVVMVLAGAGHLAPAHDDATIARVRPAAGRLNDAILERARSVGDTTFLASPVTGGGVFLLGHRRGCRTAAELAEFVWQNLDAQGRKLMSQGQTLETREANLGLLTSQASAFLDERLAILKALQIE